MQPTSTLAADPGRIPAIAAPAVPRNLKTIPQFSTEFPAFTQGGLRWLKFCSEAGHRNAKGETITPNGFAPAFVNVGRRVYIDVDKFFAIVAAQNGAGAA